MTLHGARLLVGGEVAVAIRPEVAELLFTESFWEHIRNAAGLESFVLDQYEGDEIPPERLAPVAEAARALAASYDRDGTLSATVRWRLGQDGRRTDEMTAEAPARDLHEAILAVASAADHARAAGVPLIADL